MELWNLSYLINYCFANVGSISLHPLLIFFLFKVYNGGKIQRAMLSPIWIFPQILN